MFKILSLSWIIISLSSTKNFPNWSICASVKVSIFSKIFLLSVSEIQKLFSRRVSRAVFLSIFYVKALAASSICGEEALFILSLILPITAFVSGLLTNILTIFLSVYTFNFISLYLFTRS